MRNLIGAIRWLGDPAQFVEMQRFDVGSGSDVHGEIYLITGEMQPTEDFLVPFPDSCVFGVAVLHPISLAPRFSQGYGRVCYHNRFSGLLVDSQKTAEAVGPRSSVVSTQLKQSVNEKSVDAKPYPNSFSP